MCYILTTSAVLRRPGNKTLQLRFLRNPVEIVAGPLGTAAALKLETQQLKEAGSRQVAVPTGKTEDIPVSSCLALPLCSCYVHSAAVPSLTLSVYD